MLLAPWLTFAALIASAGFFAAIARVLLRRHVSPEHAGSGAALGGWWAGIAAGFFAMSLLLAGVQLEAGSLAFRLALVEAFVLAMAWAIAGLWTHLAYVVTGWAAVSRLRHGLFAVYAFAYTTVLFGLRIEGIAAVEGDLVIAAAGTLTDGMATVYVGALFAPVGIAALAYGGLMLRAPTRATRFRLALAGTALLMVSISAASIMLADELGRSDAELGFHLLGVLAAALAYLAYAPPEPWRSRLEEPLEARGARPEAQG